MARRKKRPAVTGGPNPYPARLSHPFAPQSLFSDDAIAAIHEMALKVLEELGMKILLEEAVELYRSAGASVDGDMVRIGRDIVKSALKTAPTEIQIFAPGPARNQLLKHGAMLFGPGAGCPNATDLIEGRRPGRLVDYENALRLQQSVDVIHLLGPSAEPQDVPANTRHYAFLRAQLALCDKPIFVYARGREQVEESFEMLRLALGLTDQTFGNQVWAKTVINTNSPRQIDRPMGQGIIDFARAGQLSIITPFCLAGAMAPITVSGALVLQHAEALAGITLAQIARPGAPVVYGAFGSNVDMKSGAPAFGTPEHIQMTLGSGQLARHIGLPWRSAAGSASNTTDAQAAGETHMSMWAALLGGATMTFHAAGWLEGGLTFGFEKFVNDIEMLQTFAHLTNIPKTDQESLGWSALADVEPGGHFFATEHTMERYRDAFYTPLVADISNFGSWTDAGSKTADQRATGIWQSMLREFTPPKGATERAGRIEEFIAKGEASGGAAILD